MLNQILITPPTDGAWPLTRLFINMIESIHSSVLSYAIAILLVVLIIRLVMLPMDVWQRYTQKTMTAGQRKMGPDLAKIQKAYGHDRQLLARKQMDVYRKHGVRPLANLGTMMLNIGLTMFILITMINAINRVSLYKIDDQFAQLNSTFVSSIVLQLKAEDLVSPADVYRLDNASASDKDKIKNEIFLIYFDDITDPMIANAQGVVYNTYQDRRNGLKERFLWIENIWRRDANVAPIPTYAEAEMSGDSRNYFIATFNLNNWATLRDSGILVELIEENPTQIRQWDILGTVIRNNLEDVNTYLTTTDLTINNEPARLFWDSPAGTELTHNTAVIALMQNAANYDATVAYMLTNFQPELMQALTAEGQQRTNLSRFLLEERYDMVMMGSLQPINDARKGRNSYWNGYFLLPILVAGVTFLSVWIMRWQNKQKNVDPRKQSDQEKTQEKMQKFTLILMPTIMLIFAFNFASTLSIYILFSQIFSTGLSFGINPFVNWLVKKKEESMKNKPMVLASANEAPTKGRLEMMKENMDRKRAERKAAMAGKPKKANTRPVTKEPKIDVNDYKRPKL